MGVVFERRKKNSFIFVIGEARRITVAKRKEQRQSQKAQTPIRYTSNKRILRTSLF